jgi:SulP family sulfate permease
MHALQIPRPLNLRNDAVGGLVSAGVAIPLAMGYGMFAFVVLGNRYVPDGALAGLVTAVVLGIACVALGDKSSNVYAPRVTTTFFIGILLYSLAHSDAPMIKSGGLGLIIAVIFSIILLSGAFQCLFGLARLGTVIKLIPQPVMAGFQNAAALLLFLVQLANVFGFDQSTSFIEALREAPHARPLSVLIAAVVIVAMWNAKRFLPKIPPLLVGLAAGTVLYYAFGLAGFGGQLGPTIGSVPFNSFKLPNFPHFAEVARSPGLLSLLPTIVGGALALAIIASIDALLCAKLLARPGDPKINGDRLLMRLGAANVLAAGFGGITGGLNIGPSLDNKAFGGQTPLSTLVNAAALLVTAAALFPMLSYLPCVALSAVIMVVAVQHVDRWTLHLIRRVAAPGSTSHRRKVMLDLFVILLVATLAIAVNIVLAVFLGVAIAALLFLARMSRSIIRRLYRCGGVRSRKSRTPQEMDVLARASSTILVMELQGALFFGSAEKIANEIAAQAIQDTRYVILDLRRITEIDSTGSQILQEINADLVSHDKHLILSVAQPSEPAELLADSGVVDAVTKHKIFRDLDRAIEWAEDDVLRAGAGEVDVREEIAPEQAGILVGFTAEDVAEVKRNLKRVVFEAGRVIFREGDPGNELFIIAKGTASAFLHQAGGGDIRLLTFAPGTVFGELAILDARMRSATVATDTELVCYALTGDDFASLSARSPAVAIKLLANLARQLSHRLRQANSTIQQLEE